MKNLTKILTILILVFFFVPVSFGQTNVANGNASVIVLQPIQVSETNALNFGTLVPGTVDGDVSINTAGVRSFNNVTLVGATFSRGIFTVDGSPNAVFAVDVTDPATTIQIRNAGGDNLVVDSWVSNPADGGTGTLNGTGDGTIYVGAKLTVPAGTPAGTYNTANSSQNYTVTVNYN